MPPAKPKGMAMKDLLKFFTKKSVSNQNSGAQSGNLHRLPDSVDNWTTVDTIVNDTFSLWISNEREIEGVNENNDTKEKEDELKDRFRKIRQEYEKDEASKLEKLRRRG